MKKEVIFFSDRLLMNLNVIKKHVYRKIGTLKAEYIVDKEPIPFSARGGLKYHLILPGSIWDNHAYGAGWFRFTGRVPKSASGKTVGALINIEAEGCLVDGEGTPVQGLATIHSFIDFMQPARGKRYLPLYAPANGEETVEFDVDAGNNRLPSSAIKSAAYRQGDLVTVREDVLELYYDYLALLLQASSATHERRTKIRDGLKRAFKQARGFAEDSVAMAREELKKVREDGDPLPMDVYSIGHAHLDLAWLWPIRETKRKAGRTFANQLRNAERFPDYVFGASQPQQFQWMEERYPALFKQLQDMAARGQLEPQGAMWVECDTNLPSGESLIRQCLYGKRYWKEKFGVTEMPFCWLPDVFGFSGNLPQILKKCGMDYFLTIKLSWNEHNKFPKRTFRWQGIDGSEVLVHMPPEGNYNSDATPWALEKAIKNFPEKDKLDFFMMLFGVGDGGGGPGEAHIQTAKRLSAAADMPKVKFTTAREYFERLGTQKDKLDVFKGELYLEKHQGTYTTQGANKYYNRKLEFLLHNTEYLCAAAAAKGMVYPRKQLEMIWKEILLYQFHDIIPGSSIARVYKESVSRYRKLGEDLIGFARTALEFLREGDEGLSVFNFTPYAYKGAVRRGDDWYQADVPSYGVALLTPYQSKGAIRATESSIENDIYIVKFNYKGHIVSLFDKREGKEFAGEYLNRFVVYEDKRLHYNAWDIDWNYVHKVPADFKLISSDVSVSEGSVVRENRFRYRRSYITQKVILTEGKDTVDFETEVNWRETHKMLRVLFRPAVFADEVRCDIQMGNLTRSTRDETSVEKAQFEICAHKWVDVSEGGYGFSVLSDCKYGWRVKSGVISLNLLRSPMWPAKHADKGTHRFRYSIYPHRGDAFQAEVAKKAYWLNNQLYVTDGAFRLPFAVATSANNLVVETVKVAEDNSGLVLRVYEDAGKLTRGSVFVEGVTGTAVETDLLEQGDVAIDLNALEFKPYEIKTFVIKHTADTEKTH